MSEITPPKLPSRDLSRHGHRWTELELRHLIGMWIAEKDLEEIAAHFKVTRHAINTQVQRMRKEGVPLQRRSAGTSAGRRHQLWTQEEIEYLVRRRRDRVTAEQIAIELNRTFPAVQAMVQKLRSEGVAVEMLGCGKRRLWNPQSLQVAMAGRFLALVPEDAEAENKVAA